MLFGIHSDSPDVLPCDSRAHVPLFPGRAGRVVRDAEEESRNHSTQPPFGIDDCPTVIGVHFVQKTLIGNTNVSEIRASIELLPLRDRTRTLTAHEIIREDAHLNLMCGSKKG